MVSTAERADFDLIELYDQRGARLLRQEVRGLRQVELQLALPAGVYYYRLRGGSQVATGKWVKG